MYVKKQKSKKVAKKELYASLLGNALKSIRLHHNLKVDDVAKILNVSRTSLTNIEKGKGLLTIEHLTKICEYYEVDIEELVPKFLDAESND